ncbi:MAG TPA: YkgJ family cysteine cluster protein [Polyangiaceae bacterium]|jgi:hypothetical protein
MRKPTIILRPVWRSFRPEFLARAASHVRAGGFAAVFYPQGDIKLLLPRQRDGALTEMSLWALLALEIRRWGSARTGPAKRLAAVRAKKEHREIIREWCDRDAEQPESTREMQLDCLECGACCRDNRVVLEKPDLARWRAEKPELLGRAYIRQANGTVLLRLTPKGACVHLGKGNLCRIYPLRPDNCSEFPVGAEPCLAARLETFGLVD